jgi:heptosyltransferase-1
VNVNPLVTDSWESDVTSLNVERLLIVRLGALGDIIHTLPAATALRQAFPVAALGWLIEERWVELLCTLPTPCSGTRSPQRPLVDEVHTVNTKQWRSTPFSSQTWERMAAGLSDLRAGHYQVAVDFQGAARSALLARWSGTPVRYGFAQPRENVASMFYTRQVIARGEHIVEQNLSLAEAVAHRPLPMPQVGFPCDQAAEQQCERWLKEQAVEKFVLFNPGAGWGAKQWPAERYGSVARRLADDGLKSIVNFGPGEENLARAVEAASGGVAERLAGSLSQLIALTRRASLFIGGDTGPLHLAAALRIPVVGIYGPTDPARNGPFGASSIVLRSPSSLTTHARWARPDKGLLEIDADQVVAAARQLLSTRSPRG